MSVRVWNPEHPHHAVWREAMQSLLDGKPKVVEYATKTGTWHRENNPLDLSWDKDFEYRIARPMVERTVRYPEPLRVKPTEDTTYWAVTPNKLHPAKLQWSDDSYDNNVFAAGMAFATEQDAAEAHKALYGGGNE